MKLSQQKYNVMTVLNGGYFDFGRLFVNSFYDNIRLERVNKLYVFDTGLTQMQRDYLGGFPSLEVVPTDLNTRHEVLHDKDWCRNVYSKTAFLLDVIKRDSLPAIMIDSDCLFVKSFFDLLPADSDFVACRREDKGAFSEYIASFFAVNSVEKASAFIEEWRDEMFYGTENHKESPALTRLIYKSRYNVAALPEDIISYTGTDINKDVRIVHMKSAAALRTVKQRIHQPHLSEYIQKYLTQLPLFGAEQFLSKHPAETVAQNSQSTLCESSSVKKLSAAQQALLIKRLKNI